MNLNEAAEIARKQSWNFIGAAWAHDEANRVLTQTMLSWLDPTPITEDWLLANGWVIGKRGEWYKDISGEDFDLQYHSDESGWVFNSAVRCWAVKTLGQLQMLLWLMGGGE